MCFPGIVRPKIFLFLGCCNLGVLINIKARISTNVKKMANLLDCYKNVTKEYNIISYLPKS